MKTFKDLKFKKLHSFVDGIHASMQFDNGYGVSVIKAKGSYGYEQGLYEVGILYLGNLMYNTNITYDVIGYCSEQDVTEIMERVQKIKIKNLK